MTDLTPTGAELAFFGTLAVIVGTIWATGVVWRNLRAVLW